MRDRKAARRREFAAAQRAAILRTISNAEPTSGGAEAKPASAHGRVEGAPRGLLIHMLSTELSTGYPQPGAPIEKGPSTGNSDPGFREISGPKGLSSR